MQAVGPETESIGCRALQKVYGLHHTDFSCGFAESGAKDQSLLFCALSAKQRGLGKGLEYVLSSCLLCVQGLGVLLRIKPP